MMPLSISQILENWLNEVGIFLRKILCCQSSGFPKTPLSSFCFHDIKDVDVDGMPCKPPYNPKTYVQWFMDVHHAHMTFVINILNKFGSPWIDYPIFMLEWPNECSFLLVACFILNISPFPFETRTNEAMPFSHNRPRWPIFKRMRFLPWQRYNLRIPPLDFHSSQRGWMGKLSLLPM